jgi:mycofactocin precursor
MAVATERGGHTTMEKATQETAAPIDSPEEPEVELLVEEVSIDGLCGVY